MAVERDHQGDIAARPCVGDGLPDDLPMAEVHAVEEPDREADLAVGCFQLGGGAEYLHLNGEEYSMKRET